MRFAFVPSSARALALVAPLLIAAATGSAQAQANAPKPLGTFNDWNVYSLDEPGRTVCFAVTEPKAKKLSRDARRGDPFFMITRWGPGQTLQPSLIIGYPQKAGSKTKVKIGSETFEMFVDGDGAWMDSEEGDRKLLDALKSGSSMQVDGVSGRGTTSTDTYSLNGVSTALAKIEEACK